MNSNNDSCQNNTTIQNELVLKMLYLGGGGVSLLFCLFIFFVTLLLQKYRQTTQRLVLYLTISVSLLAIANVLHGVRLGTLKDNNAYCVTIGFIDQVTSWMVLLAVSCLTFDLFIKVIFLRFDTSAFEPLYCLTIFIVPFTFNWIPFIKNGYGVIGEQCWIKLFKNNDCSHANIYYLSLRFSLYWIPFLVILLFVFIAYICIIVKARHRLNAYLGNFDPAENAIRRLLYQEVRTYRFYPVIMLISFIIAVTSRIVEVADTSLHGPFIALRIIHILAISLQGVAIAMVFALDYDTRKQLSQCHSIKMACYSLLCCYNERQVNEYEVIQVLTDSLRSEHSFYGSS